MARPARHGGTEFRSGEVALYATAILAWAGLGLVFKPILSMVLSPLWMVCCVSLLPRLVRRSRR